MAAPTPRGAAPALLLVALPVAALLGALLGAPAPALAQIDGVCSLADNSAHNPVVLFQHPGFTDATTDDLHLTWTSIVNGAIQLTKQETNGGVVGYAWHNVQERIADGFRSDFSFTISAASRATAGDGFTYFMQADRITDLNGGTGSNLGCYGIARSVAIKVDICADRDSSSTCSQTTMALVVTKPDYTVAVQTTPVAIKNLVNDNVNHTLTVIYGGRYLAQPNILVYLDQDFTTPIINQVVGDLTLPDYFGSRFAYFGFTASTSWDQTAEIDILSWSVIMQPSDTAVKEYEQAVAQTPSAPVLQVAYGTAVTFTLERRDSCGNVLHTQLVADAYNISASLMQEGTYQYASDVIYLFPVITNQSDGTWALTFKLPAGFLGKFDLDVFVNGVRPEGMPWVAAVATFKPPPQLGGLPIWALVLLILLTLLLIAVISYVVYRLNRYRRKLRENKEFIEAGKKQAELDKLEDGTVYSANPLMGTVDDLKAQLEKNQAELERLRKRGEATEDQAYTIEQLEKQRDQLFGELNRLKREVQEADVQGQTEARFSQVQETGRAKKQFGAVQL